MTRRTLVTIGIAAYNEEQNIENLLDAILAQRLPPAMLIKEILVVASGCTDQTTSIVRSCAKRDHRIHLTIERKRTGKVTAVNKLLTKSSGRLIILISADTIPRQDAFRNLIRPLLKNKEIGMVGGRPIPVDDRKRFLGFVNHLQWELHHRLCLEHPKCGEMVAFRSLFGSRKQSAPQIPLDNVHDEAYLEMFFRSRNYRVVYMPHAIVYNKGPDTVAEFIRRRRNITAGFVQLWKRYNYKPGTAVTVRQALYFIWKMIKRYPTKTHWILAATAMQHLAATLGSRDYERGVKNPHIWDITESSKCLRAKNEKRKVQKNS